MSHKQLFCEFCSILNTNLNIPKISSFIRGDKFNITNPGLSPKRHFIKSCSHIFFRYVEFNLKYEFPHVISRAPTGFSEHAHLAVTNVTLIPCPAVSVRVFQSINYTVLFSNDISALTLRRKIRTVYLLIRTLSYASHATRNISNSLDWMLSPSQTSMTSLGHFACIC